MSTALRLPPQKAFLPVAMSFVEQSVRAYGGDAKLEYALVLAAEEIFAALCELPLSTDNLRIETRDGRYFVELRISFRSAGLDLRAFNLTANPASSNDESMRDLGLYLAARLVDSLKLSVDSDGSVCLTLIREREYPEVQDRPPELPALKGECSLTVPDTEEAKLFAAMAYARFDAALVPEYLKYPGKTGDMLASGDVRGAIARCGNGAIAGGVLWRMSGAKTVEMTGPYVFREEAKAELADALVDHCIRQAARTSAMGIFCRLTPEPLSSRHFDLLAKTQAVTLYYRHLVDDEGCAVFCDPAVEAFLRAEYDRLVLPREIRVVRQQGERMADHSVLTCEFAMQASQVTLRGLCAGQDATRNVAAHVDYLLREGIRNISFEMDLGQPQETAFTSALLAAGFAPATLVPNAGHADLLIFWKAH